MLGDGRSFVCNIHIYNIYIYIYIYANPPPKPTYTSEFCKQFVLWGNNIYIYIYVYIYIYILRPCHMVFLQQCQPRFPLDTGGVPVFPAVWADGSVRPWTQLELAEVFSLKIPQKCPKSPPSPPGEPQNRLPLLGLPVKPRQF